MNLEKRVEKPNLIRKKGLIPGVLYGKGIESVSIQVEEAEFLKLLKENGTNKTFSVKLGRKKHIVYIKKYAQEIMSPKRVIHFDLLKVSQDDTITSSVPLHFIGKEKFEKSSLVFTTNKDEVNVEYNVGSGISSIDVDVSNLTEDKPLHFKDIVVPEGIKVLNDPEELLCSLNVVTEKVEAEETEVEAETEVVEETPETTEE